jgi:hypothetical protein
MMKRAGCLVLFGLGVAVLGGCPIYPDDRDHRVCVGESCYDCPDSQYSGACVDWVCNSNLDCPTGYACGADNRCRPTGTPPGGGTCVKPSDCAPGSNCGADNRCHAGDCATTGCPSSFVCKLSNGVPACVPTGGGTTDAGGTPSTCKSDTDCPTPAGSKCLAGSCVAPENQCADASQCPAGAQCVAGACTPSCSASKPCPTGYGCDLGKGVCTQNPTPCEAGGAACGGGKVCVEEHCVDACGAGGTCGAGLVCIDGGCTPDEKPIFVCATEGVQDACQQGSICLRHSCYIGCEGDAGVDACKNADKFNVCKAVTTSSGTYSVCGSDANLGTECDPTQGKACTAPAVCIDGFCR